MKGLADYLLKEENLLNYANRTNPIPFEPNRYCYCKLYKTLSLFLSEEMEQIYLDQYSKDLQDILKNEYRFINDDGSTKLQLDKIGKLGEYTFHLLLTQFYGLDCIIPKFTLTSNRNMSIFGIDTLFYNEKENAIYFGESKVSKNINSAIKLVNESLSNYEHQILEEYRLILSNANLKLNKRFEDLFTKHTEICQSFPQFIKMAEISKIYVPVFLEHGTLSSNETIEDILVKMKTKISQRQLLGLETIYVLISLPIINKEEFTSILISKIEDKQLEYTL